MATGNPTVDPGEVAKSMNAANKGQITEALIIQAYADSVEQQPPADFGDQPNLIGYQTSINDGLTKAKAHANNYLTVIQPEIIKNMSNIGNYYALHDAVATTLPRKSTIKKWNQVLHQLQSEAETYQRDANGTTKLLKTLHDALNQDVDAFADIVQELNAAVNGDHGVLDSIKGQLGLIQSQIDGAIAALVISSISTAAGILLIVIGSCVTLGTAIAATPLVVGGFAMVVGGIGAIGGSAAGFVHLDKTRGKLLTEESTLRYEVTLATGIQSGYASLFNKVKDAASAALRMELAWQRLAGDLGTLISDLNKGLMTADQIRKLFLTDANHDVQTVIKDINIMKAQMAGVTEFVAKKGQTLSQLINATAEANKGPNPTMFMAQITPEMKAISQSTSASVATTVNAANKQQTSHALIIQNYANSVTEQSMVDFSGEAALQKYEEEINKGLQTAKDHANNYLNKIQPAIIKNISNIENYYALHDAVTSTLPAGSTEAEWLQVLTALETQSKQYQADSDAVVKLLETLHTNLATDSAQFTKVVTKLHSAVEGDHGVLNGLRDQLSSIQHHINGAIAGIVLSGLGILGGIFMTVVGAVAEFVTAGTSTALVVGGVALVLASVGGEAASSMALKKLNDTKANLLTEQADIKDEVKLATGIENGYQSLHDQVGGAVKAATSMHTAWESLSTDLGKMIADLKKGMKSPETLRELFIKAANSTVKTTIADISIIKQQMAGVNNIVANKGETVGQAIVRAAKGAQSNTWLSEASPSVINFTSNTFTKAQGASSATSEEPISLFAKAPLGATTLSQSVANLKHTEDKVRSVGNLPSAAQKIQRESAPKISQMVSQIESTQSSAVSFVKSALPKLNDVAKMLTDNLPLDDVKKVTENVCGETIGLDTIAAQVLAAIQEIINTMNGYFQQLTQIETDLNSQKIELQNKFNNAQSRESVARAKYLYLKQIAGLIPGPGLAAALALYLKIAPEEQKLEKEVHSLSSQIFSLGGIKAATNQLVADFQDIFIKVSLVEKTVSFVSNDVLQVKSDLSTKDARLVVELDVKAAIAEVKKLSVDALGSDVST